MTAQLYGFELDDGAIVLPAPVLSRRRMEIIGDSITCGYGNEGIPPCSNSVAVENNYMSYGSVTARALDAVLFTEAWSGMGMVRNVGYPARLSPNPFPTKYPYALGNSTLYPWNFTLYVMCVMW